LLLLCVVLCVAEESMVRFYLLPETTPTINSNCTVSHTRIFYTD
jgi:hypothetical protein